MGHIAFLVEPSYGHLVPMMGLVCELIRHGHRVTCPTTAEFASRITTCGAEPIVYQPPEARLKIWRQAQQPDGSFSLEGEGFEDFFAETNRLLNSSTASQLSTLYGDDPPDLLVHVRWLQLAAKFLAEQWDIPRVLYFPALPWKPEMDGALGLVAVPKFFFQQEADQFDDKFFFMGFTATGRKEFFQPWNSSRPANQMILVSATTGLLPQVEFFRSAIQALEDCSCQVILSTGNDVDPSLLGPLPQNFQVNTQAANFEILEHANLFVGQAGQGVTLEAIYWGVPQLVIPPAPGHKVIARRLVDLGLGRSLEVSEASVDNIRDCAGSLLGDKEMLARLQEARALMRQEEVQRAAVLLGELF